MDPDRVDLRTILEGRARSPASQIRPDSIARVAGSTRRQLDPLPGRGHAERLDRGVSGGRRHEFTTA